MDLLANFKNARVMIVGDVMLDQYWWGSVSRISPEAPVPVVQIQRKSLAAGGAANVAANIAALGATPVLIGVIGGDQEGSQIREVIEQGGVRVDGDRVSDRALTLAKGKAYVVQVGKRKVARITLA